MTTTDLRPRLKVIAASLGTFVATAVILLNDLGIQVKDDSDGWIVALAAAVASFVSGYMKRDGVVG